MHKSLKLGIVAGVLTSALLSSQANAVFIPKMFTGNGWNAPIAVFGSYVNPDDGKTQGWRIPAIAALGNGVIVAVADKRYEAADVVQGDSVFKVDFGYRVSLDGGTTWTEIGMIRPDVGDTPDQSGLNRANKNDWYKFISDPQIVHNPDTGSTFVFGYHSDSNLYKRGKYNLVMFRSDDGGRSWDGGVALNKIMKLDDGGGRYVKFLQGPGNGMYYNGKLYVPIQAFGKHWDKASDYGNDESKIPSVSSSGMLVSEDDGKTWKQSSWVLNADEILDGNGVDKQGTRKTSESSVFHHKGYVYLAAKVEDPYHPGAKRQTWRTKDDGKTWERVEENFLPDGIVQCQSSSFALTDNVYFVGYTTSENGSNERNYTWLTTNTGRRIQLYSRAEVGYKNKGYSSISADADNLYVLYEGADTWISNNSFPAVNDLAGAILLRRFDYAGKEYANLNGRLQRAGSNLLSLVDTFSSASAPYINGGYGPDNDAGFEGVYVNGRYKVGLFYDVTSDVADDVYRTYGYDETTASALFGIDGFFAAGDAFSDSLFAGYQYATAEFSNSAKEESHAAIAGYRLGVKTDLVDYALTAAYRHASNTLERNGQEGLNKEAEYATDVIAVDNRVSKTFALDQAGVFNLRPFAGFEYIHFKHEGYSEKNGNGFNDITVDSASNNSYGPYVGAELFGEKTLVSGAKISYSISARYKREMADAEDWTDSYTVFDERFSFAAPVDTDGFDNIFEGSAEVMLAVNDSVSLGISGSTSSIGDGKVLFKGEYRF